MYKSLKGPSHCSDLVRYTKTSDPKSSLRTSDTFGPFLVHNASETCRLAKYWDIFDVASRTAAARSNVEEFCKSFGSSSRRSAPHTKSLETSSSGPVESFTDFTAACNAASLS